MPEQLFFESIKEHCGAYFVEYQPPVAGNTFATLSLVFPESPELSHVADLMQSELKRWLIRYPVPLMITAFDAKEDIIRTNENPDDCHLVGWRAPAKDEVVSSWKIEDLSAFQKTALPVADWRKIYTDVPFRTHTQVKANADKYVQEQRQNNLILKLLLGFWLVVIPACWAIFEYMGPGWLGLIVLIFTLWNLWKTWRKLTGRAKLSRLESEKAEKERKMAHYFYHCERNPEGFARLKAENFTKDIREQNLKEAEKLAALLQKSDS